MSIIKDIGKLGDKAVKTASSWLEVSERQPTYITPLESETRFVIIGPVASGKTVFAANLLRTAITRTRIDPDFYLEVKEYGSGIRETVARLCDGHFPPKTIPTGEYAYESGLIIAKKAFFGKKQLHLPLIDVAGEDQQLMLHKYASPHEARRPVNYLTAKTLLEYMKSSKGVILTLCGTRIPLPGQQLEEEPTGISRYADVNMARMLDETFSFKKAKPECIIVVVTKWDQVAPHLITTDDKGIDLYRTKTDMDRFMWNYFSQTKSALKELEEEGKVHYFPSYVSLEKNAKGEVQHWKSGEPKVEIITKDQDGYPCLTYRYAESSYYAMLDLLEGYAK